MTARSTGTRTPCSDRQPSSSTAVSLLFSAIRGLTTATRAPVRVRLKDEHAPQHADLGRGQPDTARVLHQRCHAGDESLQVAVELRDLVRLQPQRAVAVLADLREGELPSRLGLGVELLVVGVFAQRVVEHLPMRMLVPVVVVIGLHGGEVY